ncbi:MAG: LapA family protein [Methylophilaceae bacterium]|nr:LapA family protein [Methylophilaceae bacterium]
MMRLINFILLFVLVTLIIFATINWQAIVTPMLLSLLFANIEAPLGLVLLSITGLLLLLFLGFIVYMQSSTLMIRRKLTKALEAQRKLADDAEVSRITELRRYLETELQALKVQSTEVHQQTESHLAALEASVKDSLEETGRTLSAYIGELEDRMENKQ